MAKTHRVNLIFYVLIGVLLCGIGVNRFRHRLSDRLLEAAGRNDEAEVVKWLRWGADPNYIQQSPRSPNVQVSVLTEAIQPQEDLRVIQTLLEGGAKATLTPPRGQPPLGIAISVKRADILRLLLEKGVRVTSAENSTLTHLAAAQSSPECYRLLREYGFPSTIQDAVRIGDIADVKRFLDQGEDVNQRNTYDATLLMQALTYRQTEIVKLLVARGADVNLASRFSTPLRLAQQIRNPELITLLETKGAHIGLVEAIRRRDLATVRTYVREGADVNVVPPDYVSGKPNPEFAPLFQAITLQDSELVHLLLDAGANVHMRAQKGRTPLIWSVMRGNSEIVRALIAKGADLNAVDTYHLNAMKIAMLYKHEELYPLLKAHGAQVDLFDASTVGDVEQIRRLAHQGVDVNQPSKEGNTPLMLAAMRGQIPAMHALMDLGAEVDSVNAQGETALLKVAWTDQTESVRVLLDKGANPNAAVEGGRSALLRAAEAGRLEILRELLARGADPNAISQRGDTALHLAERLGHADAAALLRQAGAQE